jgi:crotonobetainyl-CoA:carnitine CoA-transferase CaiB-like acyl-CoA transferase
MSGLLDGVRVVEFSHLIAAPLCGLTLQDMGAEVVKVEPPEGDYTRTLEPIVAPGVSGYFQMLNRGKRGVSVDLREEGGRELARRLIDAADVVVESLGEGRSALGIDYEEASSRNEQLIWCSISGYGRGQAGRAIDPTLQASMGMMALTGEPDRPPMRLPVPLVDFMTGMYAISSVLAAMLRVRSGGSGALLDCGMVDSAAVLASSVGVHAVNGSALRRMGTQNPWYVPAANFEASDGQWVQVMAVTEQHWRALCEALGHPEWLEDSRFAGNEERVAHREAVHSALADVIRTDTAGHWEQAVIAAGGFCQRIREIEEAWSDPLLAERGLVTEIDGEELGALKVPVASLADRGTKTLRPRAPRLGEHTEELAKELGISA